MKKDLFKQLNQEPLLVFLGLAVLFLLMIVAGFFLQSFQGDFAEKTLVQEKEPTKSWQAGYQRGLRDGLRQIALNQLDPLPADPSPPNSQSLLLGQGGVLVLGDSLGTASNPYLRAISQRPLRAAARGGYDSRQIYNLFQKNYRQQDSVVVFAAGTNDDPRNPGQIGTMISKIRKEIGSNRCLVLLTVARRPVWGLGPESINRRIMAWQNQPGLRIVDWARLVRSRPDLLQADRVHTTSRGSFVRARLIHRAIEGCFYR